MAKTRLIINKDIIQYIFIYLLIISHDAQIYAVNTLPLRYGIICLCSIYTLLNYRKLNIKLLQHMIGFIVLMGVLTITHMDRSYFDKCLAIVEHIFITLAAFGISKDKFVTRYIKVVSIIALISIPFFIIQCVQPELLTMILSSTKGWGEGYSWATDFYGEIFYTYRATVAGIRNNSIFTEPGIFQMILNSAIFMLLFLPNLCHLSGKWRNKLVLFLSIVLVTTGSTTGYIALAAIIIVYILKKDRQDQNKFKRYIELMAFIGVVLLIWDYFSNQETSIIQTFVIDKFTEMQEVEYASGNARILTMTICGELIWNNPMGLLTGITYYTVNRALYLTNSIAAGCKIVPFITATGLPVSLYMLWPYFISPLFKKRRIAEKILYCFLYWNTALTQSREMYPALIVLPLLLAYEETIRSGTIKAMAIGNIDTKYKNSAAERKIR